MGCLLKYNNVQTECKISAESISFKTGYDPILTSYTQEFYTKSEIMNDSYLSCEYVRYKLSHENNDPTYTKIKLNLDVSRQSLKIHKYKIYNKDYPDLSSIISVMVSTDTDIGFDYPLSNNLFIDGECQHNTQVFESSPRLRLIYLNGLFNNIKRGTTDKHAVSGKKMNMAPLHSSTTDIMFRMFGHINFEASTRVLGNTRLSVDLEENDNGIGITHLVRILDAYMDILDPNVLNLFNSELTCLFKEEDKAILTSDYLKIYKIKYEQSRRIPISSDDYTSIANPMTLFLVHDYINPSDINNKAGYYQLSVLRSTLSIYTKGGLWYNTKNLTNSTTTNLSNYLSCEINLYGPGTAYKTDLVPGTNGKNVDVFNIKLAPDKTDILGMIRLHAVYISGALKKYEIAAMSRLDTYGTSQFIRKKDITNGN